MLKWFRETAPIRRKLSIAFSLQAILILSCLITALATVQKPALAQISWIVCAAALVVSAVLGIVMRHAIVDPYVATVVRMEALAAGDVDSPVHFTAYSDCVGRMTRAMRVFKDNAMRAQALEREQAEARARRVEEDERTRHQAEQEMAALVVNSIGVGLEKLAAGDLTFQLTAELPPAYEGLRASLNATMTKLKELMQGIVSNTSGIRSSTGEISSAADDLSRRTEQQAASLEQTAAALDQITATVRKTAEGATHAREVVGAAQADAERSGVVVGEAVAAMSRIETSSQQISNIIGVIDEIAFQTNLLALNAGVEAARAGDAGRGFAVVASEVRALAQRSADAAKEIKALISTSTQQVVAGVDLVGQTGQALRRIVGQIGEINGVVVQIAASAQEQATGLHQVNAAVNQMDQVTQQNAAMVEQSTAASHSLAQETEELAGLIGRFQISGEAEPPRAMPRKAARPAPAPRPAPAKPAAPRLQPPRKLETVTTDGWEEF
jgi:methyl-accepting chemotaxis protein